MTVPPAPEPQPESGPMPPPVPPAGAPVGTSMPAPPPAYAMPVGLSLPPGTTLASVGRRIGAYFLAIVLFVVTLGVGYIVWGIIAWTKGTTPALQVLGCRLWLPDQQQVPGFGRALLRNVVGYLVENIIWIVSVVSFILFLTNSEHKSLHDMIGGTIVLHDPNKVLAPPR